MDCWVQRVATGGRSRVLINPTELFWGILIGRHAKFLLTLINKKKPQSFLGRFYFNFYLRVFPSWEPLMDYETSAIHLFLFFLLIESAPKRSGGSETSIMSSSFTFERPHVRFELTQI